MKWLALMIAAIFAMGAASGRWVDRAGEATTVQILDDFAVQYDQATNDMVRGALRRDRGHALCSHLGFIQTRGAVHEWTGTVETLDSTGDGAACSPFALVRMPRCARPIMLFRRALASSRR